MKPYRVEYVQLAGWEADEIGLWVAENEEWLLLHRIPVDYIIDGYVLIAKAHIVSRKPGKHCKRTGQILKLKGIKAEVPEGFQFQGVVEMLRWVEQHYGLVEFSDKEESSFFGWIDKVDSVHFWAAMLWADGTTQLASDTDPFVISEIQTISFDNDYSQSVKLLWQHKQRSKLWKPSDN
jgi:hypothetical protein